MLPKSDVSGSLEYLVKLQKEAEEKFVQYQNSLHKFQEALIAQLSEMAGKSPEMPSAAQGQLEATPVKRGRGRPPKLKIEPVAKRDPVSPPKHRVEPSASQSADFSSDPLLDRVVWETLGKGSLYFKRHIADYPSKVHGLKVSELKQIIENEKSWAGSSENIGPMIQKSLYQLRENKKIDRNDDDRRYFIIRGSQFED